MELDENREAVVYASGNIPDWYKCGVCGVSGVKLWREYNTFGPDLFCADCAAKDQKQDISDLDANGKHTSSLREKTDQIYGLMPAIPDEENIGYWGYTSVPAVGIAWWRSLPSREGAFVMLYEKDDLQLVQERAIAINPMTRQEFSGKVYQIGSGSKVSRFFVSPHLGNRVIDEEKTDGKGRYYLLYDSQGIEIHQGLSPDWPDLY